MGFILPCTIGRLLPSSYRQAYDPPLRLKQKISHVIIKQLLGFEIILIERCGRHVTSLPAMTIPAPRHFWKRQY